MRVAQVIETDLRQSGADTDRLEPVSPVCRNLYQVKLARISHES